MNKGIVYTSDGSAPESVLKYCLNKLTDISKLLDIPMVKVSNSPEKKRGHQAIYENILLGIQLLRGLDVDYVHLVEHDCIYSVEYFMDPMSGNHIIGSNNVVYLCDGFFIPRNLTGAPLSTIRGPIDVIESEINKKLSSVKNGTFNNIAEPPHAVIRSEMVIDIRHGNNFTGSRTGQKIWLICHKVKSTGEIKTYNAKELTKEVYGA